MTVAGPQPAAPNTPKRVRVFPRSNVRIQSQSFETPDGRERVTIADSGVNIIVEGIASVGTIDIATDRVVIWSPASGGGLNLDASGGDNDGRGAGGTALEFYMEGNIVFRQGDRVIYAKSMYYNVQQENGVVLDAELLTAVPSFAGVVRLKAEVLRQLDSSRFQAHQAAITTSRLGVPSYWFQSGDLAFEDRQIPLVDPASGLVAVDELGEPLVQNQRLAASRNNYIYVGEIPVFYWPFMSTDLTQPTTVINRVRFDRDRIFGTQIGVGVDLNQIFNLKGRFPTTSWSGTLDYLSQRGWGFGTSYEYAFSEFLGIPGPTLGFLDAWGIQDTGLDNLGRDRPALVPEANFRGRVLWQHRQRAANGLQITGEVGVVSDRNFLEQYYEREWDLWKDQDTGFELKYLTGASSWNLSSYFRVNNGFTQTEWLPRLDQYQLGESLFQERMTWFGHSQAGYGKLKIASVPRDPEDAADFNRLRWEVEREGIRVGGRHELDLPLQVGAVKVVPYVLGEVMHWGEDIDGVSNTRLYGQAGVRAAVPVWTVDPTVRNPLFDLNGMAHKVVFEGEFLFADANENLDQFPLYDQVDDDANEHFRRRYVDFDFGGTPFVDDFAPLKFDERYFGLRSGLQSWVTSPSTEIADDLTLLRLAVRQRWQTKRGLPACQRVVDWMTLDVEGTYFPDADRDNFGAGVGLLKYDWRWHAGNRLSFMSDGYADTFSDGLKVFTIGGYIGRPERGSAYLGFRSVGGPIDANVLISSFNYRMTPKWIASAGVVTDFGPTGNIGEVVQVTRVGESFLVSLEVNADSGRNNLGVGFFIEPRFLPLSYRGRLGGVAIPPVGAYGLE